MIPVSSCVWLPGVAAIEGGGIVVRGGGMGRVLKQGGGGERMVFSTELNS